MNVLQKYAYLVGWLLGFALSACTSAPEAENDQKLFKTLSPETTGIHFSNDIQETFFWNYFLYPHMYSGGGVAIGDVNNDGLPDIFFTGCMVPNRLYLNKGQLQFEDITQQAGVRGNEQWMAGVTMADVNGDGFLDIYVCVAGKSSKERQNLLYINNGDLSFIESAEKFGLNDASHSIQATFFDYDRDGDLDMYLANYPIDYNRTNRYYYEHIQNPGDDETDRLYRNENNTHFVDVTDEAGIRNYGLSLSATVGDLNNDGWPDLYIANDFNTPDYVYINQKNGRFEEASQQVLRHMSNFGMGVDIADYNNDGWLDVIELDMMAEDNRRKKTNMSGMNPAGFREAVNYGFHYQYMYNTLQLNNGVDENGLLTFSEVGQLGGVSATDWSWAPLLADLDNDGWKDLFITNGMRRDVRNNDFLKGYNDTAAIEKDIENEMQRMFTQMHQIPVEKMHNYAYKNQGDLTFSKVSAAWGLDFYGFSNGAAYADLDRDGDLDLVINNLDSVALIFENQATALNGHHYLQVQLNGPKGNRFGIGTKVRLRHGNKEQYQELTQTRGFQSSVEPILHFGLGAVEKVDEVAVIWPDGKYQIFTPVDANQVLTVDYAEAANREKSALVAKTTLFEEVTNALNVAYKHTENEYNDFEEEILLPHKMSAFGPGLAVGDVNGDGREDFYVGGAAGFAGAMYTQQEDGQFRMMPSGPWQQDQQQEDMGAILFDADHDGDLDLYVVSGGNEFAADAPELQDRLYLNNGKGQFQKAADALPPMYTSGSCVRACDYDHDGDLDLFVGGRVVPGKYPYPAKSYLLENQEGRFVDVTEEVAPGLIQPGLVTDARWTDYDSDGDQDLIVVGEWMPISFFKNQGGKFLADTTIKFDYTQQNSNHEQTEDGTLPIALGNVKSEKQHSINKIQRPTDMTGWWFSIAEGDLDNDGDMDYVVGNLGLNYKYKATPEAPFQVYAHDFDKSGNTDIVLGYYHEGSLYPLRGRECSSDQMPFLKKKFPDYASFATATLDEVYNPEKLEDALHYKATHFSSVQLENLGEGQFRVKPLPIQAQISAINGIVIEDFDGDGYQDVLVAGNLYASEVETPRNDAGIGLFLQGTGQGELNAIPGRESRFIVPYDTKALATLRVKGKQHILVANNDDYLKIFKVHP